jgi:hypothetical protein
VVLFCWLGGLLDIRPCILAANIGAKLGSNDFVEVYDLLIRQVAEMLGFQLLKLVLLSLGNVKEAGNGKPNR